MSEYKIQPQLVNFIYEKYDGDITLVKDYLKKININNEDSRAIYDWFAATYFLKKDAMGVFNVKKAFKELSPTEDFEYLTNIPLEWMYNDLEGSLLHENANKFFDELELSDIEKIAIHFLKEDITNSRYEQFLFNLFGAKEASKKCLDTFKNDIIEHFSDLLPELYNLESWMGSSELNKDIGELPIPLKHVGTPTKFIVRWDIIKDNLKEIGAILTKDNIQQLNEFYYQKSIGFNEIEQAYKLSIILKKSPEDFARDMYNGMLLEDRLKEVLGKYSEDEQKRIRKIFNEKYFENLKNEYDLQKCIKLVYTLFNENDNGHLLKTIMLGIEKEKEGYHDRSKDDENNIADVDTDSNMFPKDFVLELFRHFYEKDKSAKNFDKLYKRSGLKEPSNDLILFASYCKHADILVEDFDKLINNNKDKWREKDKKIFKKSYKKMVSLIKNQVPIDERPSEEDLKDPEGVTMLWAFKEYSDKSIQKILNSKFKHPINDKLINFDITSGWDNVKQIFDDELCDIRKNICERLVEKCDGYKEDNALYCDVYLTALLNAHEGIGNGWDDEFSYFNNPGESIGCFLKKGRKLKISKEHGSDVGICMQGDLIATENIKTHACFLANSGNAHFLKNCGNGLAEYALKLEILVNGNTGNDALSYARKIKARFEGNVGDNLAEDASNSEIFVGGNTGNYALKNARNVKSHFKGNVGDNFGNGSKKCNVTLEGEVGEISKSMLSGNLNMPNNTKEEHPITGSLSRKLGYGGAGLIGLGSFLATTGLNSTALFNYLSGVLIVAGGVSSFLGWGSYEYSKSWIEDHNKKVKEKKKKLEDAEEDVESLVEKVEYSPKKVDEIKKSYGNGEISEGFYNICLKNCPNPEKKQCPICGMEINAKENVCPICNNSDFTQPKRIVRKPIKKIVRTPMGEQK